MRRYRYSKTWVVLAFVGILCSVALIGCQKPLNISAPSSPQRDINVVLADYDDKLLAISGVVGVYIGLMGDGKTPCLKVMLARKDPKLERAIPHRIEGYSVVTEVTGVIKPLRNQSR